MKYDAINLIAGAARRMKRNDPGTAYALFELANNLREVMRKEASVDAFLGCYCGHEREPFDLDKEVPAP